MSTAHDGEQPLRVLGELRSEFLRIATADRPSRPRVRPVALGLALVVFVAAATATAMLRDATSKRAQERPALNGSRGASQVTSKEGEPGPASGFSAHGTIYATASELVRRSDLIMIGTVKETVVGDVFSEDREENPTRILHTTVAAEEILKGSHVPAEVTVPTDELAFMVPNVEDWREPGQRVLLFLTPSREGNDPRIYILSNINYLQAAYFIDGDSITKTVGGDPTEVSDRIAAMSVPQLEAFVDAASQ